MASAATRGVWINLLCAMWWAPSRGILVGTREELCKLANCTEGEFGQFLIENSRLNFADVTNSHNAVTVKNRRMVREEKIRESARCRKSRQRSRESHAPVTPASPSTPSTAAPIPSSASAEEGLKKKSQGNPNVAVLIRYFHDTFVERFGRKPVIHGGKCGEAAKRLLVGRELEEAKRIVRDHLFRPDDFSQRKGLYGLEHVAMAATKIVARWRTEEEIRP